MINYKAVRKRNPQTKEIKWYPAIVLGNPVLLDELTELIALNCTVTEHDIKAVISALQEQIILALRQGRSVRLGEIGSFRLTMTGKPSDTAEKVKVENITGLNVQFTKSSDLEDAFQLTSKGISFHKVSPKKEDEETTEPPSGGSGSSDDGEL